MNAKILVVGDGAAARAVGSRLFCGGELMLAQSWSEASDRLAAKPRLVFVLPPRREPGEPACGDGEQAEVASATATATPSADARAARSSDAAAAMSGPTVCEASEEPPLAWIRRVRRGGFHAPVVLLGPPHGCSPRSDEFEGLGAFSVMRIDRDEAGPGRGGSDAGPRDAAAGGAAADGTASGRGGRVLVLSQRRSLWQFARYVLERSCFEVLCTRSRDTLLESLARDGADLMLIDAALGADSTAAETSREVRRHARWARLPLLWSTPVGSGDLTRQASKAGADHLLREPLTGRDLLDAVTRLTRHRAASGAPSR